MRVDYAQLNKTIVALLQSETDAAVGCPSETSAAGDPPPRVETRQSAGATGGSRPVVGYR